MRESQYSRDLIDLFLPIGYEVKYVKDGITLLQRGISRRKFTIIAVQSKKCFASDSTLEFD
jgi:hypothetical protein